MKKIQLIFLILTVFSLVLCSCKKDDGDKADTVGGNENTDISSDEENDADFLPISHATECYFTFYSTGAFDSYLAAFPNDWVDFYAEKLGTDADGFYEKVISASEREVEDRSVLYGNYTIEYLTLAEEALSESEVEEIKNSMTEWGIDSERLSDSKRCYYMLSYVSADDNSDVIYQQTVVVRFIKLSKTDNGDDYGWYVLPDDYHGIV